MSTTYEANGTVIFIGDTQQIKDTFRKRAFVVQIGDGNYPQEVQFEVTKDNCQALDAFKVGDAIRVLFNIRGRGYDKKDGSGKGWFTSLEAWKIDGGSKTEQPKDLTNAFDDVPF